MIKGGRILFVSPRNSVRRKSFISSSSQAQGANTVTVKTVKSISLSQINDIITSSLRDFSGVLHDLLPKVLINKRSLLNYGKLNSFLNFSDV